MTVRKNLSQTGKAYRFAPLSAFNQLIHDLHRLSRVLCHFKGEAYV